MYDDLESVLPPVTAVGRHSITCGQPPSARYNKISEKLRQTTPLDVQCSMFCGGQKCKYDSATYWKTEDMALNGIFSHWITEDILAMARPCTEKIEKYHLIQQFREHNIKSIINLQQQGEHAHCGNPLEDCGFSYDPQVFMDNNVFYYNFPWRDYGVVTLASLLDVVKVMAFALTEGKVAIHCHAGLGRTGVLIASYLVFVLRCKSNDAIRYLRIKRPNAIQTRRQIICVQQFAQFVIPLLTVYPHVIPNAHPFSLNQYLNQQRKVLHGYEARHLKYIPKIVYMVCERLLELSGCNNRNEKRTVPTLVNLIRYQLSERNGFWTSFLAASVPDEYYWRPFSQITTATSSVSSEQQQEWVEDPPNHVFSSEGSGITTRKHNPRPSCTKSRYTKPQTQSPLIRKEPSYQHSDTTPPGTADTAVNVTSSDRSLNSSQNSGATVGTVGGREYTPDFEPESSDESIESVEYHSKANLSANSCYQELSSTSEFKSLQKTSNLCTRVTTKDIVRALMEEQSMLGKEHTVALKRFQKDLNSRGSSWERLKTETDLLLLVGLLWSWLEHLKVPVLSKQDLTFIVIGGEKPVEVLTSLDRGTRYTVEYLIHFVSRLGLQIEDERDEVIRRLVAALSQQCLGIGGVLRPAGVKWPKMGEGTTEKVLRFITRLYCLVSGILPPDDSNNNEEENNALYMGINIMATAIGRTGSVLR
ncbi:protein tyrosine phosphatase domain-containing protein 1-like [Tachypleus tridentatus]|uniref:protein tyrosine phosphatase domain-containing protein 1-like n=1 Tax=Tachypleus tridentatus TaxID=6853 RepID=UPI003FD3A7E2